MKIKLIKRKRASGFTLIELMISLALGLIVLSGLISVYVAIVVSSSDTLAMSKVSQQTSALMNIITNDVRRAGYWGQGVTPLTDYLERDLSANPFSLNGITALGLINNIAGNALITGNGAATGECLVYTYDSNEDGGLDNLDDNADIVGFRLKDTIVQMRRLGDFTDATQVSCKVGTWEDLTDGDLISVDTLTFSLLNSVCINTNEPDGLDNNGDGVVDEDVETDCYTTIPANASGDITVETLQINITIEASLVSDSDVKVQMNQIVRVRNDRVRVW